MQRAARSARCSYLHENRPCTDCTDDSPSAPTIPLQTHARLAITETRRPPPRHRRHALREFSMTDHTTPTPEPPADPNRDPEDDPLSPPSPGHHHDNPQQPDGPPSKDPV